MVSYLQIEEFVARCQRAMEKKTPLEKIETLVRIKRLMYIDLMDEWTKRGVSNNWVCWWWEAVKITHHSFLQKIQSCKNHLDELNADRLYYEKLFERFPKIDINNFIPWMDYLIDAENDKYVSLETTGEDVGPGHMYVFEDFGMPPRRERAYQNDYDNLNKKHPLPSTVSRPTVSMMDVYFCELINVLEREIEKLSRDAYIDGQVKKPQDALPKEEYAESAGQEL